METGADRIRKDLEEDIKGLLYEQQEKEQELEEKRKEIEGLKEELNLYRGDAKDILQERAQCLKRTVEIFEQKGKELWDESEQDNPFFNADEVKTRIDNTLDTTFKISMFSFMLNIAATMLCWMFRLRIFVLCLFCEQKVKAAEAEKTRMASMIYSAFGNLSEAGTERGKDSDGANLDICPAEASDLKGGIRQFNFLLKLQRTTFEGMLSEKENLLQQIKSEAAEEKEQLTNQIQEGDREKAKLAKEKEFLTNRIREADQRKAEMVKENEFLSNRIREDEQEKTRLSRELDSERIRLDMELKNKKRISESLAKTEAELEEKKRTLQNEYNKNQELTQKLEDQGKVLTDHQKNIEILNKTIQDQADDISQKDSKIKMLDERKTALEEEVSRVKGTLGTMKAVIFIGIGVAAFFCIVMVL